MEKSTFEKFAVPILALVGLLVCVAWLAGGFDEKVAPETINHQGKSVDDVYHVTSQTHQVYEPVSASVTAKQASIISSRILARIDKVAVRAGDNVKAGQLLISLEQSDLLSQVEQAKEQISAIEARYLEAKKNFERSTTIHQQKLISDGDLDKAKSNFDSLSAELRTSKQALVQAETTLSYSQLNAPITGRIVDRFAEPGDTAQPGVKLLSIYNPLSLRVEGQVREALALQLNQGQKITVELPSVHKSLEGVIEEIVPAADTGSRSFLVKASIDYQEKLLPGMYARMLIPSDNESVISIPKDRIAQVGQLSVVWVNDNGQPQRRFIRVGKLLDENSVSVISGLKEGEQVLLIP